MDQHEFNDRILDKLEALEKENAALKKQLKAVDNAEELLAKLTIASDQAQSLHSSLMVERKNSAEQSIQTRKELKDEIDSAFARLATTKSQVTNQVNIALRKNAEAEDMLRQVQESNSEFSSMRESLLERQNHVVQNVDSKVEELNRHAGQQYIRELFDNEDRRKNNQTASEEIQRQLRVLFNQGAEPVQQPQEPAD